MSLVKGVLLQWLGVRLEVPRRWHWLAQTAELFPSTCVSFLGLPQGPPTVWLKTAEIYALTVLEIRRWESRCTQGHTPPRALGKNSSLFLPASGGCHQCLGMQLRHPDLYLCCHTTFFLVCLCLCVSLFMKSPVIGFRVHLNPV